MHRAALCFGAGLAMLGCGPDAVWFPGEGGTLEIHIAAEQSDLCHPDCSTEALQVSKEMTFLIAAAPGTYQAPAPADGGTGFDGFSVGGVCDQVPGWPRTAFGIVTLTHVPSSVADRVEGSYQVDPSGGPYGFTKGSFSAHSCR